MRLRDVADITRGEINQTTLREFISQDPAHRPLLKGVEVRMFGFNQQLSQGEREYFNERLFERKRNGRRLPVTCIATQRITGIDEKGGSFVRCHRTKLTSRIPPIQLFRIQR